MTVTEEAGNWASVKGKGIVLAVTDDLVAVPL